MRSSISPTGCGPTSDAPISMRSSTPTPSATVALAGSTRRPCGAPASRARRAGRAAGRAFDVARALVAAGACAPLYATAVALILADDGRPVLFRQERLGRGRRPFSILKLRTMRDGRVTRAGRWLRATGIDET